MIVLATKNLGKIAEFERLIDHKFKVVGLNVFPDMPDVDETGSTLVENAYLKANAIAKFTSLPCLSDDSGLFISALNDEPGVFSARYASDKFSDSTQTEKELFATNPARANIDKVLRKLAGKSNRKAEFRTVVAFVDLKNNQRFDFLGRLPGEIAQTLRGENGFGYDPIFIPNNLDRTLAQLTAEQKDSISHRFRAFEQARPVIMAALNS